MPFAIPTLGDLVARARAAFRAFLPGTDAWLWPNNIYVTAKVLGASHADLAARIAFAAKQALTIDADDAYLDRHGAEYNLPRKPATLAAGAAIVTATDALTIPAGTLFARSDGLQYAASADRAIAAGGTLAVPLVALTAGAAGLATSGTPLTLGAGSTFGGGHAIDPFGAGLATATAVVDTAGVTGGADVEGPEPYRARILFRKQNPPRGGAPSDWVIWGTAVPGCTRVFVERLPHGPGSVRLYPLFDDLFVGGVPDVARAQAVVAEFAQPTIAPGAADWSVAMAKACPINVVIQGLKPLTTAVENAVRAEIVDMVRRRSAVAGMDSGLGGMDFLAVPQTFSRSWVSQAIANATGEDRHILVQPAGDITIPAGAIATPGQVSFQ